MKKAFTRAWAVCAVRLIGVGILAILNGPEIEPAAQRAQPAAQPTQPAQPAAQSTEPPVKQEQAQTEQAKLTEQGKPTERLVSTALLIRAVASTALVLVRRSAHWTVGDK